MIIITGPNMAGKSTVIRQAALMVIMAQTGSFIPAREAEIGTADRIFTRIGAVDDLARGRSTFMVEMNETAEILKYSTKKSLILLDEIGRGTSTYDGISIAWAVAEYIHNKIGARTLFATHYHELTEITKTLPMAKNYSVAVKEWNDEVIFLRKLKEGPTSRSYGIQVGKLAGLPENVINRAREILKNLETSGSDAEVQSENKKNRIKCSSDRQISLFGDEKIIHSDEQKHSEIINELSAQEIDILSPLEALNLISAWKRKLKT
jgi:DNA mismatch repair protein MutS